MINTKKFPKKEKAILIGVELPEHHNGEVSDNLSELKNLTETAGLTVLQKIIQERRQIHPAHFIGSGKVQDLKSILEETGATVVIFDEDLSPAQIRNLERMLEAKIIDRSTLILDIFAKHARTKAAKTQVELAQLQYLLPRLTRQWVHLSRQVGGIGTKGPGETQLETDRRLVRNRIEKLRNDLSQINQQREVRRKNRRDLFRASLVGYTNAGKSTIMNLLSGSKVLVQNQLFATLDSTVRRIKLNDNHDMLLSDTVGFIRKLPHHLIESFKSTLDEVKDSDLLLHVVDVHHSHFREQMQTVLEVLESLDMHKKPILIIFNKLDLLSEMGIMHTLKLEYPDSVFMSAQRKLGVETLLQNIVEFLEKNFVSSQLTVPMEYQKFIHYIYSVALVENQQYQDNKTEISFKCNPSTHKQILQRYQSILS